MISTPINDNYVIQPQNVINASVNAIINGIINQGTLSVSWQATANPLQKWNGGEESEERRMKGSSEAAKREFYVVLREYYTWLVKIPMPSVLCLGVPRGVQMATRGNE